LKAIDYDSTQVFIYNNLGSVYRLKKEFSKAIYAYTQALKINPEYLLALNNRGATYLENNLLDSARSDFENVIALDPRNFSALNNLASVEIKNQNYKKASEYASRSIEINARNGAAYYNRGIARQMLREDVGCCEDWERALELGVSNVKSLVQSICNE